MIPEEHSAQQWAAVVSLLRAQIGPGNQLPTVMDVRASVDLWTEELPAVGVQLQRIRVVPEFTKKHHTYADFLILASVKSEAIVGPPYIPPNLDDANARLQTIIADGAGNGLANILRDPVNHTLSGMAARMIVTGVEYSWEIGRGAVGSDQVWAHAIVSVTIEDYVSIA
jgi:hypothetical protein